MITGQCLWERKCEEPALFSVINAQDISISAGARVCVCEECTVCTFVRRSCDTKELCQVRQYESGRRAA